VLATGVLLWFRALRRLVGAVLDRLEGGHGSLRSLVRELDAAYAALVTTATSLRRVTFGRTSGHVTEILAVSSASRQYARSLAALLPDTEATGDPPAADNGDRRLRGATGQLRASLDAIERRLTTGEDADYVRSASLFTLAVHDVGDRRPPLAVMLDDLTRLDGAMAALAAVLGMRVTDHDTQPVGAGPVGAGPGGAGPVGGGPVGPDPVETGPAGVSRSLGRTGGGS
jgi:hypothetical protein